MNEESKIAARGILASTMRSDRVVAVKRYDFWRPDKFSRDELRTVSVIHEALARANSATLSALCRFPCVLRIRAVDQLNFGEYQDLVGETSVFGTASLAPLPGSFVFSMDEAVAAAVIELLGGALPPTERLTPASAGNAPDTRPADGAARPAADAPGRRGVTDLERAVLGSVWSRLVEDLAEAWRPILDAEGRLEGLRPSGSRDIRVVNDSEMIVLVAFDCTVGAAKGEITFALPFLFLEPIIPKLTAERYYAPRKRASTGPSSPAALDRIPLPASLYYEAGELSLARLHALKPGDLLPLAESRDGTLLFEVGGKPLLRMERPRKGDGGSYVVTSTSVRGSALAAPGTRDGERGRAAGDAAGPVAVIAAGVEASLKRMERRLEDISARQDELADRAYFGEEAGARGEEGGDGPLAFAAGLDRRRLAAFLADEHPQTSAVVLSAVDGATAGDLLSLLPAGLQGEVARRIARLGPASPLLIAELESTLRRRTDLGRGERVDARGGADHLAEMRKSAAPATAATIAEILGERS